MASPETTIERIPRREPPRYYVGFDPAHGPDMAVEVVFERMPDGRLRIVDRGQVIEGEVVQDAG